MISDYHCRVYYQINLRTVSITLNYFYLFWFIILMIILVVIIFRLFIDRLD